MIRPLHSFRSTAHALAAASSIVLAFSAAAALFPYAAVAADKVEVRKQIQRRIQLKAGQQTINAEVKFMETRIGRGQAAMVDRNVITVYDPATNLFWWTYQNPDGSADAAAAETVFQNEYRVLEDRDRLIGFVLTGWSLWVRISTSKATSLQDGVDRLVGSLPQSIETIEADISSGFHEVNLAQVLGSEFLVRKSEGAGSRVLWLVNVEREPSRWIVTLRNARNDVKTVALNDNFEVAGLVNR